VRELSFCEEGEQQVSQLLESTLDAA
jgi:hypothetical protein